MCVTSIPHLPPWLGLLRLPDAPAQRPPSPPVECLASAGDTWVQLIHTGLKSYRAATRVSPKALFNSGARLSKELFQAALAADEVAMTDHCATLDARFKTLRNSILHCIIRSSRVSLALLDPKQALDCLIGYKSAEGTGGGKQARVLAGCRSRASAVWAGAEVAAGHPKYEQLFLSAIF